MKKIYACLTGQWVCLNDDNNCFMGEHRVPPSQWWEEAADIYAPLERKKKDTLYEFPYVNIHYKGKDYRINPMFIQIVSGPE